MEVQDDAPDETLNVFQQFDARKTLLSQNTCYDEDDFTKLRVQTLLAVTRSDDEDSAIRGIPPEGELAHETSPSSTLNCRIKAPAPLCAVRSTIRWA